MRYLLRVSLLILALYVLSCSGRSALETDEAADAGFTPLLGSSTAGISVRQIDSEQLRLVFESIPPDGQFLRLALPAGRIVAEEEWYGVDYVLHVVGNSPTGPEIGVRPVDGYQGSPVSVVLRTAAGGHTVSGPPSGPWNAVMDLEIAHLGGGRIRLEWTEVNVGDYNFDSLVGVADLTPLGVNFEATYDPLVDGTVNNTLFWVDGNRDGLVGISDITPIGQHFDTRIIGYNVLRNGIVVHSQPGDPVTISREQAQIRPKLPPKYVVEFDSLPEDEWSVAPVDPDGLMGTQSESVNLPFPADLLVDLSITGLDLFDLDGSGEFGALGFSGRSSMRVVDSGEVMRRIAEGDVPNLMPVGNGADEDTPTARFYALPRDKALALLVMYAPVVDLASGEPKSGSPAHGPSQAISIEHETTAIPFRLPPASETATLVVDIVFSANPGGGYFTDITTELNSVGEPMTSHVQLNNLAGLVAMDNDGDDNPGLEFTDEAQLADPDTLGVSDRRLEQEIDTDDYGDTAEIEVYAVVDSWVEAAGSLQLRDAQLYHPLNGRNDLPSLMVFVSEDSDFIAQGGADLDPSLLIVNDRVFLETVQLSDAAHDPAVKHWLRGLTLLTEPIAPQASLSAAPLSGPAPLTVSFDASQSFDPDGYITKFEFDFGEGAGWEDFGTTATTDHTYTVDGSYLVRARVTDDSMPTPQTSISPPRTISVGTGLGSTITVTVTVNFNGFQGATTGTLIRLLALPGDTLVDQRFMTHEDGIPGSEQFDDVPAGAWHINLRRIVTTWTGYGDVEADENVTVPPDASLEFTGEQIENPPPPG